MPLCPWLLSIPIMSSRFIHVVACVRISILFKIEFYSIVCVVHILFIHSFLFGCLGFHHLTLENTVSMKVKVAQTLCNPMDYRVHGILWARILQWVASPFSRGSSQLRMEPDVQPRSPALQADSLRAEPQGKPKNTGVGNLSLLQPSFQPRN